MSQATPVIGANKSGLTYRQEDNDGKQALLNHHKGATAPSYAEAGMIWLDDSATPWLLRFHDGTDWITLGAVNAATNAFMPYQGAAEMRYAAHAADTGSANAYAIAPVPAISAYATGQVFTLRPGNANTGAATLNVNSKGAVGIKLMDGADPAANALVATGAYFLFYNGSSFVLLNPSPTGVVAALPSASGLTIANNTATPNTKADVAAGFAVMRGTGDSTVFASAVSVTVDLSTTGANGLDAGTLANSTWYYIWLISNGTTTAGLASTSATAPTLPGAYTYKLRIGAMLTGPSGNLMRTLQKGSRAQYVVTPSTNTAGMPLMASGAAGSVTTPTYVSVDTTSFVPATAAKIAGSLRANASTAILAPNANYGASSSTSNPPPVISQNANPISLPFEMLLETSNVYWASQNANGYLWCSGWQDNVNAS